MACSFSTSANQINGLFHPNQPSWAVTLRKTWTEKLKSKTLLPAERNKKVIGFVIIGAQSARENSTSFLFFYFDFKVNIEMHFCGKKPCKFDDAEEKNIKNTKKCTKLHKSHFHI